jgi:hypothetical protein
VSSDIVVAEIQDVDVVYTWVNDKDPEWQKLHESATKNLDQAKNRHGSVNDMARYQNRDEIKYSINSLRRYAPWVRNIYIVTNCTLPAWAQHDQQIIRVDHKDIFPDTSVLPTFNAFAIEACLHRIEGLSEHFIFFNDDVFLMDHLSISDFFPAAGEVSLFISKHDIPPVWRDDLRPVEFSMINTREILEDRFDFRPTKRLQHAPFPLIRSVMRKIESEYSEQLALTRSHAFRDPTDLPLSTTLHAYYCLATGSGRINPLPARYIDIGDPLFIFLILPYSPLMRNKYAFLCLNEVTSIKWLPKLRDRIVVKLMKRLFPPVVT